MPAEPPPTLAEQIAAALDWWREAGVEHAYHDAPAPWLSAARPTAAEAARERAAFAAPPPTSGEPPPGAGALPPRADWPREPAGFAAWWLAEPALDDGRLAGRVPPRGLAEPELMVIVPEPEADDDTRLLAGPQGRLLDAMLAAMAVAADRVYVASVLARHTPTPDWPALAAREFGALTAHHVAIVRPRRLAVFGLHILSLLNHDPPNSPAASTVFAHEGLHIPMLAARSLAALLDRPAAKAVVWRAWLEATR